MMGRLRNALRLAKPATTLPLRFDRPLLLFQSDDWGRVGVRDREGWEALCAAGLDLGAKPYDFYSLETAEDVRALAEVLSQHRDSVGRNPSMAMNFITANVDFDSCFGSQGNEIPLVPLTDGLPGRWQRAGLFEAYREGIRKGLFFAALHGLSHFCRNAVMRALECDGERRQLIHKMWSAQTPYIHWRMPWVGFEYWDGELEPKHRALPFEDQRAAIQRAAEIYGALFSSTPLSACAPGYRANGDTVAAWLEAGVRVVQNGPGGSQAPYLDRRGVLHTFRTVEMEPAVGRCDLRDLVRSVGEFFRSGLPAVVSVHSINFHSTLRDFRTPTLALMDELLTAIEKQWPNLLYVNDGDLLGIATEGFYRAQGEKINVRATGAGAKSGK